MQNQSQDPEFLFNTQIDYSNIGEDKTLPYVIELDMENSILTPSKGQNQRFCYQITGVGDYNVQSADLTSFTLNIGDEITADQILNISVEINEILQDINFKKGGNVELLAPEDPDSGSKNAGLRFNFELSRISGLMTVCFELATLFPVGLNSIKLAGNDFTVSGLTIGGPICGDLNTCPAMFYQNASISVPITIMPYANTGATKTYCCGGSRKCCCNAAFDNTSVSHSCSFTLTQKICIAIPIEFGADVTVGNPFVNYDEPAIEDNDEADNKVSEVVSESTNNNTSSSSSFSSSPSDNIYFKNLFRAPRIYPRLR